jgi:hypothetical protein
MAPESRIMTEVPESLLMCGPSPSAVTAEEPVPPFHSSLSCLLSHAETPPPLPLSLSRPETRSASGGRRSNGGGVPGGGRLRLPLQGGAHRRLRRRQVQPALPLHAQRVQPRVQVHHRRRVRHPLPPGRRQGRQGPDLGHRRSGAVRTFTSSFCPLIPPLSQLP